MHSGVDLAPPRVDLARRNDIEADFLAGVAPATNTAAEQLECSMGLRVHGHHRSQEWDCDLRDDRVALSGADGAIESAVTSQRIGRPIIQDRKIRKASLPRIPCISACSFSGRLFLWCRFYLPERQSRAVGVAIRHQSHRVTPA